MITLESSADLNPSHDTLSRTVPQGGACEFTITNLATAPLTVSPLSAPQGHDRHGASTIAIDGRHVTISEFAAPGRHTYRVDFGADWLMVELDVTA